MEILHIIPAGGTSVIPLAELLQRCDSDNRHTFLVTTPFQTVLKTNMELLRIRDLRCMPIFGRFKATRKLLYLHEQAKKADRVVWHTLKTNGGYTPFFLFLFRDILKKSMWIPCEGEIGNHTSVSNKVLNRCVQRISHHVQRRFRWIGLNCESDKTLLEEFAVTRPNVRVLPYVVGEYKQNALDLCRTGHTRTNRTKKLFLQIGLSSQRGNNHRELLEKLSDFPDLDKAFAFIPFRFIIPGIRYSGGTKPYMNKIRSAAAKTGMNVACPDKLVSVEDYVNRLSKMDMVILGNHESIQMGMLTCLLSMNKRIFMQDTSPLFRYLNEQGAGIHTLEELAEAGSLEAAMKLPGSRLPEALLQQYATDNILTLWKNWCAETEA